MVFDWEGEREKEEKEEEGGDRGGRRRSWEELLGCEAIWAVHPLVADRTDVVDSRRTDDHHQLQYLSSRDIDFMQ